MKKKVLIVEDEFVVANDLEIMLEASGYETTGIAASVAAAQELMIKHTPDLVLLDIQLQGELTGIDLAEQLKSRNIPFIYLSANSDQHTLLKAKATEPYGFLVKPIRPKDLLVTLEIASYRHEHSQESYLFRKDRLRRDLVMLLNEQNDKVTLLSRLAESLQLAVSFELLCFSYTDNDGKHYFRGVYRSSFNEYQEIDNNGLSMIATRSNINVEKALSGSTGYCTMQQLSGSAYETLVQQDMLVGLLDRCYNFRAVMQGDIHAPGLNRCRLNIFSKASDAFDDRQVAVLSEMQELIGRLMVGMNQQGNRVLPVSVAGRNPLTSQLMEQFIGKSHAISHCLDLMEQVAPLNTSVLITGESGTGKELLAAAIHEISQRNRQPFIKINCAALPYSLIESELFGYEKGAFTGAVSNRMGKFEAASGGTIFLDEIGEMSMDVQAKLLRVLQEKKVQRVGSHKMIETDVRLIAATNRNLEQAVAEHRFRLDLYFRLNVFPIHLPPLRQRKEDIPLLADYLGKKIAKSIGREYYGISSEMLEALEHYDWPGNVRELENIMERALIMSGNNKAMTLLQPLSAMRLPVTSNEPDFIPGSMEQLKQQQEKSERELIASVLRASRGRIRGAGGAAEQLNMKPTTLESKLIRLGIRKEDFQ